MGAGCTERSTLVIPGQVKLMFSPCSTLEIHITVFTSEAMSSEAKTSTINPRLMRLLKLPSVSGIPAFQDLAKIMGGLVETLQVRRLLLLYETLVY